MVTLFLAIIVGMILLTNLLKIGKVDTAFYELNETQMNLTELGEVKLSETGLPTFFVLNKHVNSK